MSPFASFLLILSSLALVSLAGAQERAPHGIAYESPTAFFPSAFEFFHPKAHDPNSENPCSASNCSPSLPVAAHDSKALGGKVSSTPYKSGHGVGAGGIAGIVLGLAFAVVLAMGVYYVLNNRRTNANGASIIVQPDA